MKKLNMGLVINSNAGIVGGGLGGKLLGLVGGGAMLAIVAVVKKMMAK
ncbi:MAG: hypothetical protein JKY31_01755 [Rhodobacteraceae bacterium]|nr:hypothetical protein [Paracoccaceae bacterium]